MTAENALISRAAAFFRARVWVARIVREEGCNQDLGQQSWARGSLGPLWQMSPNIHFGLQSRVARVSPLSHPRSVSS